MLQDVELLLLNTGYSVYTDTIVIYDWHAWEQKIEKKFKFCKNGFYISALFQEVES